MSETKLRSNACLSVEHEQEQCGLNASPFRPLTLDCNKTVIKCRKVVGGRAEGEALVSAEAIGTFGCLDEATGVITERGHCIQGESVTGKVLVFPQAKGSSGWAATFLLLRNNGMAPSAMLINRIDSRSALGSVLCEAPTVSDFDIDPLTAIETGDWVEVNADDGQVVVTKKSRGAAR